MCSPLIGLAGALFVAGTVHQGVIDGITFAENPSVLYAPLRETAEALGWRVSYFGPGDIFVNDAELNFNMRSLLDGTTLVQVRDLAKLGAEVLWDAEAREAVLYATNEVRVRLGEKRVFISKSDQEIKAWQGDRLVFSSQVSTGRRGHQTPNGDFVAGPYKARMHRSSLYDDAPMPWSVQITGNIFVHGYHTVPNRPDSHGCIRLPVSGANYAKWFYDWVEIGTPVSVTGEWR